MKSVKTFWPLGVLVAVLLVVAGACGGDDDTTDKDTLTIVVSDFSREVLEPGIGITSGKQYHGYMYDWLIGTLPSGELVGDLGLAQSWEIGSGAQSLKLNLRRNVKWHDGRDFTADDVVFTLKERDRAEDAVCTFCRQLKRLVDDVVALDDFTVDIRLGEGDLTFFGNLGSRDSDIVMLPRHNYRQTSDGGYELIGDPIGTGAWKFVERTIGQSITYEVNNDYWNSQHVPEWRKLQVLLRSEATVRLGMLRTGEADMVQLDAGQLDAARDLGFRIDGVDGFATIVMAFHASYDDRFFTKKLDFRKALNLALDMDAMFDRFYPEGTGVRAATAFWNSPVAVGYVPGLSLYRYDPDEARRLIEASGYDGTPLKVWSFVPSWAPEAKELLEVAAGYWEAVGINVELTPLDFGAFRPRYASNPQQFEGGFAGHIAIDTPPSRPLALPNIAVAWLSHDNGGIIQSYHDLAGVDALYNNALKSQTMDELSTKIQAINRQSYEEYPMVPIVLRNDLWALGPEIASWEPGGFGFGRHFETLKRAN